MSTNSRVLFLALLKVTLVAPKILWFSKPKADRALLLNPRICLHICLHTDTDHPQTPCLYGSTLDVCSHNPLVPGSSPGGPTRNENTSLRAGIFLSVTLSNSYCLPSALDTKSIKALTRADALCLSE